MFITKFTCPTEDEYLPLPGFGCRNAEQIFPPCTFDNDFKRHSHIFSF